MPTKSAHLLSARSLVRRDRSLNCMWRIFLLVFIAASLCRVEARAHGGEDHGESQPRITATATEVKHLARAGDLEILVKHAPISADQATAARIFLSRYATNEPIGKAHITLRLAGPAGTEVAAKESRTAGQYELELPPLSPGTYRLSVRVEAASENVEVDLGTFEVALANSAVRDDFSTSRLFAWFMLFGIAAASALFFVWRIAGRRPKKEAKEATVV